MSEDHDTKPRHESLNAALAAAQAEMGMAAKDSANPHFKSRYASLASVLQASLPALTRHGIALAQPFVEREDGSLAVDTTLLHESGESLSTTVPLFLRERRDMQALGSAATYARRYGLMALAGIAAADEDDDGQASTAAAPSSPPSEPSRRERAEAFAAQLRARWSSMSGAELQAEWERRRGALDELHEVFPDIFDALVQEFEGKAQAQAPHDA